MTPLNFINPTASEITNYLQSKGLKTRAEGDQIITNKCPFCRENKEDWTHFYISTKGLYFCHKCFTGNSLVRTSNGIKEIRDIKKGDFVLTKEGRYKEVLNTISRKYTGKLTTLSCNSSIDLLDITCTPNHLLSVFSCNPRSKKLKNQKRNFKSLAKQSIWLEADKIKPLYGLEMPIIDRRDIYEVSRFYPNYCGDASSYILSAKGPVPKVITEEMFNDGEFWWCVGLYIADGAKSSRCITFAFHKKEQKNIDRVKKLFTKYGFNSLQSSISPNGESLQVFGVYLERWFEKNCGRGAENKHIPNCLLSSNILPNILEGYFAGDGFKKQNSSKTVSKKLAIQIYFALWGLGRTASINSEEEKIDKKGVHHKKCWTIRWDCSENSVKGIKFLKKIVTTEVKNVDVYDLTVEDSHTYNVSGCAVHNCGKSGNIITLAKFYNDYTKPEIEPSNGSNSRNLSETVKSPQELEKPQEKENKGPSEVEMKRYQTSIEEYHKTLLEKKDDKNSVTGQIYEYLTVTRKLLPETLEHFKIGWTGTSISIPIFENSKVVNIRYRGNPLDPEAPKMMNVHGGKMVLFNGDVIKGANKLVITEGEIDAMSLYQEGWENVVSVTCGAQTFKQEWADAMQKVNSIYLCYEKGTKIYTRQGLKNIEDIKVSDSVWTHIGNLKEVYKVMKNVYSGEMRKFSIVGQTKNTENWVTSNHPILVYEKENIKYIKNRREFLKEPIWKKAGEIREGDYLLFPKFGSELGVSFSFFERRITQKISERDERGRLKEGSEFGEEFIDIANTKMIQDKDFSYLLGLFLGDGHYSRKYRFELAYNTKTKKHILERVKKFFDKYKIKYSTVEKGNIGCLYSYDSRLYGFKNFYQEVAGDSSKMMPRMKSVSYDIFRSSLNKKEILQGLIDSDGTIDKKYKYIKFSNTNESIIKFFEILALQCGYGFTTHDWSYKEKTWKKRYTVSLAEISPSKKCQVQMKKFWENFYLLNRVRKISIKQVIDEETYNIDVKDDHSYITEQKVISHNCYDNDEAGQKGNLLAIEKLGASRCRIIEIPKEPGQKDLNDFFAVKKKTVDDFNNLYNSAKKITVESEHIKKIKEVAKTAMEEMKNPNVLRGMSTGWKLLDDVWRGMRDGNLIVISGDTGVGKCHAKGTKVLMYNGTLKKVEDIKIGDKLMGPDSTPRTVLKLARGREKMWKVEPKKGAENFVVNRNHLLHLKKNTKKYPHYPDTIDITIDNWIKLASKRKHVYYLEHPKSIKFKEKKVSLEPYFLGLWLGDGTSSGPCVTSADFEIEKYLRDYANRLNLQLVTKNQPNNKSKYYCLTREKKFEGVNKTHKGKYIYKTGKKGYGSALSLLSLLKKENLIENKHIPQNYKINSEKNRLELLAGLIDSDGNKEKVGYSFSNKNKQLCEDVIFLARSLGFFASTLKERTTTCLGRNFQSYRVYISGDVKRIPLKVKRKIVKKEVTDINWLTTRFRIWEWPVGDYYGFSLDKDQLYILENFIINHNTFFTQNMVMNIVNHKDEKNNPDPIPVMYFSLEQTPEEIAERFMMLQGNVRQSELIKKDAKGEFSKLEEVYKGIASKPIYLYSGYEKINTQLLGSVSEKAVKDFGCRIIFIDHLHFFASGDSRNRTIEISDIVRYCKLLARKLMVPVVLICHIKKLGNDNDKPTMEDLKDSSAIKQDADIVALLWRKRMANRELEKWARINIDKNRHGKSGERFFIVNEDTCKFEESLYGPTESKDTEEDPAQDPKIAKPPMNIPQGV
jgi:replicative DNA helicase